MGKKTETYKTYQIRQKLVPYLFLAPNLIIFSIFIILPAIIGIYYSFTNINLFSFGSEQFIGLANYARLLQDKLFLAALWNTIKLALVSVPLVFVSALCIALLLIQPIKLKGFFRAMYYWPVMIAPIVVGIIWQWILSGNYSLFNTVIKALGFAPNATLTNPTFAWWTVVFAVIWSRSGYYMIIFVAALLSISPSLYEAADMDGAGRLQKFFYVTYPSLKAARLMVMILVTMEIFKMYPIVVTLTGGGPYDATMFTVQYIYEMAFQRYNVGLASAMSVVMLLIVTIVSGVNFFLSKGGND